MSHEAVRRKSPGIRARAGLVLLALLVSASAALTDEPAPPGPEAKPPADSSPVQSSTPAQDSVPPDLAERQGTLTLALAGNRQFCVVMNELEFSGASPSKPRQQREAPLITTMGYKYQISVSRRGTSGVTKLLESPTIHTTYYEKPKPVSETPQPRLPTKKDRKDATRPFGASAKIPRWIANSACTTLKPEYSFPLLEGRYDVYLGFDLLTPNGRWVPLQSDFVVDLMIEKGKEARVEGKVDYSGGERVVTLSAPGKKASSGSR